MIEPNLKDRVPAFVPDIHLPVRAGFQFGEDFPPQVGANRHSPFASGFIVLKNRFRIGARKFALADVD